MNRFIARSRATNITAFHLETVQVGNLAIRMVMGRSEVDLGINESPYQVLIKSHDFTEI